MTVLIRSTALDGFRELAAHYGHHAEPLLRQFNLDGADPESATDLAPYAAVVRLFEAAAKTFDCPNLGVRLSRRQSLDKLGPMALLARNCRNVEAAIRTVTSHMHTYTPAVMMELVCRPGEPATLYYDIDTAIAGVPSRPQMTEFSLAVAVRGLHLLAGEQFRPAAVLFRHHPPLPPGAYEADFGVAPLYGQDINALLIDRHWLEQPVHLADDRLRQAVDEYLEPLIDNDPLLIERQVEHLIGRLLPTGHCSLQTVARQLAMHPRTLQRKLHRTGWRFEDMADRCRRDRARELLADSRIPLSQIAGLIGYTEQSTLTRSCRRWFGDTPRRLRRRAADG